MLDSGNTHVLLSDHIGRINDKSFDGYRNWKSLGAQIGVAERKLVVDGGDDDSGVCSPPLWRSSPNSSPQHRKNHYRSLSPSSRTQAIARGQRELMEMVGRMPESCYELSMKDLVEQPMIESKQESFREETKSSVKSNDDKGLLKKKKNEKKQIQMMKRSGSADNERFLLKMIFPVYLGSKKNNNNKKKNDSLSNNNCSKITVCDGSDKGVDKDWWNKRFTKNSASAKSSASSSSSSSTNREGSCWGFMRTKKSKKVKQEGSKFDT
ncbi:hypothetical protein LWI28_006263 [Acer negundo]|uniref:Uncharacterized protein n=1 Tax=Acer negundo TaxID=4023 RepID=A0AAD5JVM7_ACENE|nr:hypothetical protein LWI28_006263 [Acer negundo]KAK4859964.1 hypothetical protein QYF36_015102 [Acer negundo]